MSARPGPRSLCYLSLDLRAPLPHAARSGARSPSPFAWKTTQFRGAPAAIFTFTWFTKRFEGPGPSGKRGSVDTVSPFTIVSSELASIQLGARLSF